MTLALCMIVKNEEQILARCLNSCKDLFDEIIIVDTGSSDNTVEIAKTFTQNIYHFEWIDDFSAARNFSFSFATCDFIMWLDADDIITPIQLDELKKLKASLNNSINVVMLKYSIAFDEQNNPTFSYYRERIFNKLDNFIWQDAVHEAITPKGNVIYKDIYIYHKKIKETPVGRNLKIYEKMVKDKKHFKPRQLFYYARELYFNKKFIEAIKVFNKFFKTKNAFKENYIEACLNTSRCYSALKNPEKAKQVLFKSFAYDLPRSEILCEIGMLYLIEKDYKKSVYYYLLALNNTPNYESGAFVLEQCYNFLPYMQLSVCYYYLNNIETALHYHNKAKQLNPNDLLIISNDKFFSKL